MTADRRPLHELISQLPEVYQPIYGRPAENTAPARASVDRLGLIEETYKALAAHLGRPLSVLDLGCSQGYFSLSLAALGADVCGVDSLAENVALCQALAAENSDLAAHFTVADIAQFASWRQGRSWDLVLGLSVFHHLIHRDGMASVLEVMRDLSLAADVALYELAVSEEPLYWAEALPKEPRRLLTAYDFVLEIGRFPTHLSARQRPMLVASNKFALLGGANVHPFSSAKTRPYALAGDTYADSRRYFFSSATIIKVFRLDGPLGEHNRKELQREAEVLSLQPQALVAAPALIEWGSSDREAWLVRESKPGTLLLDLLPSSATLDTSRVIDDILEQLVLLEGHGLYHTDLRVWNVLIDDNGRAHLIDYGSVERTSRDSVWPGEAFLSFFLFVFEVVHRQVVRIGPLRQPFISPLNLPEPFRSCWLPVWRNAELATFKSLQSALLERQRSVTPPNSHEHWMAAMERLLDTVVSDGISREESSNTTVAALATDLTRFSTTLVRRIEDGDRAIQRVEEANASQAREVAVLRSDLNQGVVGLEDLHLRYASLDALRPEIFRLHQATANTSGAIRSLQASMRLGSTQDRSDLRDLRKRLVHLDETVAHLELLSVCSHSSVRQLLMKKGDIFIRHAYYSILRRPPDASGLSHYRQLLGEGQRRIDVITHLLKSPESHAAGHTLRGSRRTRLALVMLSTPVIGKLTRVWLACCGLHALVDDWGLEGKLTPASIAQLAPERNLWGLLAIDDEDFVAAAFAVLLGRVPDPEEASAYAGYGRTDLSRLTLLAQLKRRPEAGQRRAKVRDLSTTLALVSLLRQLSGRYRLT